MQDEKQKTYTLTLTKPKVKDFICGVKAKNLASTIKDQEKSGFTVTVEEEKPYPKA